jgi:hypothetical protein
MKVKAKILSSGDIGWFDFWGGIEKWVHDRSVEIARDPELAEFESDAEREQGLRIVKGIWDRMAESTNTAYRFRKEQLDKLEEQTLSISRPILRQYGGTMRNDRLINEISKFYPTHKEDTIRRRLTSIVGKGQLECKHVGKDVFYALTASDRIKREIVA